MHLALQGCREWIRELAAHPEYSKQYAFDIRTDLIAYRKAAFGKFSKLAIDLRTACDELEEIRLS